MLIKVAEKRAAMVRIGCTGVNDDFASRRLILTTFLLNPADIRRVP